MPALTLRRCFPMAHPMASQQRGQRRKPRVRGLRRCPHGGHFPHSASQGIRGIMCGVVPTLHLPESEQSSNACARTDAPPTGYPSLRTLEHEEEAFGTHRRSVSAGIGQIGVCFFSRRTQMRPNMKCCIQSHNSVLRPSADKRPFFPLASRPRPRTSCAP